MADLGAEDHPLSRIDPMCPDLHDHLETAWTVAPGESATAHAPWSPPSDEFLGKISHEFARRHLVLSEGCREGVERLVAVETIGPTVVFNIGVRLERRTEVRYADPAEVASAVDRAYAGAQLRLENAGEHSSVVVEGSETVDADLQAAVRDTERDLLQTHGKARAVRLVDLVLFEAVLRGASDVHVQPLRTRTLVRYRLDGALHTVRELPASLAGSVVSRIKVMARLDVAEHRTPQDGRATVTIGGASGTQAGRRIDLRVSTLPSTYGERVVMRLLDPSHSPHLKNFGSLGMPEEIESSYLQQVGNTSGIVLSTGPTGSGKTTTLYTTLAWLSSSNAGLQARGCELNMMTVEDPVEYDLSLGGAGLAVSQTQVDPKKGLTFATGLKHILRQDPDVIMVGEVRDEETARIAVQASLTGHLVLSTLHTNDAASAVVRLLDLGIEPYLVSSSLSTVLAQRLVRTIHRACSGVGCAECVSTGFKGRTGLFELLLLDDAIRQMVCERASVVCIKQSAQRSGMTTLREAGRRLVASGATTMPEVDRVIDAIGEVEP